MQDARRPIDDRQLDALLERLDGIQEELHTLNRRLESQDTLLRIARELANLNESLEALAYAALGRQPPQVRRRRTG
jgi:archaellum component FlaC